MSQVYLYHATKETVHEMIAGRLVSIPPEEPTLIEDSVMVEAGMKNGGPLEHVTPADFIAEAIMAHKHYHGIVRVPVVRTKNGFTFDVEAAHAASLKAIQAADEILLQEYITIQQQREKEKQSIQAPSGRYKEIIERRGIDLKNYGLNPVGHGIEAVKARDAEMREKDQQIAALQDTVAQLAAQMQAFLAGASHQGQAPAPLSKAPKDK